MLHRISVDDALDIDGGLCTGRWMLDGNKTLEAGQKRWTLNRTMDRALVLDIRQDSGVCTEPQDTTLA